MMLLSIILNYIFIFSGIITAFIIDLPTGATIILITGTGYLLSFFIKNVIKRLSAVN
jgi:ABC-type Mn2+/Zn2+ transport system permease subunit